MVDNTQYGIDNDTTNDAEKGAALGGLGGAAVGAAAGSLAGPLGTVLGAVAGGLIGAGASGAAVAAVDQIDNDATVSGLGDGTPLDSNDARLRGTGTTPTTDAGYEGIGYETSYDPITGTNTVPAANTVPLTHTVDTGVASDVPGGHNVVTGGPATTSAGSTGLAAGALAGGLVGTAIGGPVGAVVGGTLGSLAGGVAGDAAEASDEEYLSAADDDIAARNNYSGAAYQAQGSMNPAITPIDTIDTSRVNDDVLQPSDQTDYRNVDNGLTSIGATDQNADMTTAGGLSTPGVRIGNDVPGIQTGGTTTAGADTRGIVEKTTDAVTGDNVDDKTGGRIINDKANGNY